MADKKYNGSCTGLYCLFYVFLRHQELVFGTYCFRARRITELQPSYGSHGTSTTVQIRSLGNTYVTLMKKSDRHMSYLTMFAFDTSVRL